MEISTFLDFLEYVFVLNDIYMKNNTYKLHIWTTLAIKGSYFIKSRYFRICRKSRDYDVIWSIYDWRVYDLAMKILHFS